MFKVISYWGVITIVLLKALSATAVTLVEKDEWKVNLGGFVELDSIYDSTRSLPETLGNAPINRPSTVKGDTPQTQISVRHSRFSFTILAPNFNEWKSKAYIEMDFLGYNPSPSTSAPTNSESSFYTTPTMRLRHGYMALEKSGWTLLLGQSWSFFGWDPYYVLSTVSPSPVAGTIYQRTPQVTVIKESEGVGEKDKLQVGLSFARPSQRDSQYPNLDGGVRYSFGSRSSGFSTSSGDVKVQNMSLAVSGTYRSFISTAAGDPSTAALTKYTGYGIAVNGLIPVITSGDSKSPGGSLTVTGEFAWGAGIGDAYSSWSGNLAQLSASSGTSASPTLNLDSGQGAIDSSGNFQLAKIQSWNAQLQYHFADDGANFLTAGYGQLYFLNSAQFPSTAASSGNILYDRPDAFFINYVRDLTKQWRMGLEYSRLSTHYADGVWAVNNRIMTNFWLRF